MKNMLCCFICIIAITLSAIPIYANVDEQDNLINCPASSSSVYAQTSNEFVEGAIVPIEVQVIEIQNGHPYITVTPILAMCVSIGVPYTSNRVEAFQVLQEMEDIYIERWNESYSANFPNAVRLRTATSYYNCHSYAWYSEGSNNDYWIPFPDEFFDGNDSYEEVYSPAVGDIICYYRESDNKIIHSGIVTAVNVQASNDLCGNSNTVEVISKWGPGGLYKHNGYECQYTTGSNPATTVKYYRYHSHVFTYVRNIVNPSVHTATCSTCGYSFEEYHNHRPLPDGSTRCSKCGYVSSGNIIMSEPSKPIGK